MAEHGGEPRPRLMIRQMVLENFKSYAGTQYVGPFHKNFSAVVGPNGSGKSNVIDAMLFVFGRRAKQLRFNKVSELIHNSTNHRALERACVTVHFQEIIDREGADFEAVPGSDFTVARTATRANTSDYYVNGKKQSVKEVTALLKEKGIDLDNNRFLILQGEVEQISLMRPKSEGEGPGRDSSPGLLEYLEDIIGTDKLVPRIEEEGKKLEEMNEKRASMIGKLKSVEKEVEGLAAKKEVAEAYLSKQAERINSQITGNKLRLLKTQKELAEVESKAEEFEARLEHESGKLGSYGDELAAVEKAHADADAACASLQRDLDAAQAQFKQFELKDTKVRTDLKHLKAKLKKAAAKKEADGSEANTLEADIARWGEEVPAAEAMAGQLAAELTEAESKLEGLLEGIKGEVEAHHLALAKARGGGGRVRKELAPWEAQMSEVQGRIDVATSERDMLLRRSEDAKERLEAARAQLEAAKKAAADKGKEIAAIEKEMAQSREAALKMAAQLEEGAAQEAELEGRLRGLRQRVAALKAESAGAKSASAAVQVLMEAKRSGEIPGVYGRLGDLGAIDARYDVAVSTACPALDYIVVETTSDAQRCVELLRRRQAGVATCLILEKQRHLAAAMNGRATPPGGSQRLFDLVRTKDANTRLAFWYALRNTLVVESMEAASSIAYGAGRKDSRWARVVTMDGQLIAESGTMSGGGARQTRGRMRLGAAAPGGAGAAADAKALEKELAAAEREAAQVEGALRAAREARDGAERSARTLEKRLGELELAAPKAAQVAAAKRQEAEDVQARLAELEAATKVSSDDAARLKELSAALAGETSGMAKLRASCSGLQKKAAEVQAKIDGAGGEPLRRARDRVAKLSSKIAECEAAAAKMRAQSKAAGKQLEKLRKDSVKQDAEVSKLEGDIATSMDALKQLETDAMDVMTRVEELQSAREAAAAAVEESRRRRDDKQREVGVIRGVQVELEAALEKLRAARREAGAGAKQLEKAVKGDEAKLKEYTDAPPAELSEAQRALSGAALQDAVDAAFFAVTVLDEQLRSMNPDLAAIEAYRAREGDLRSKQEELAAATAERDAVRGEYDSLRKARLDGFMAGFNSISLRLKEMYQMITLGGDAELELVDTLDPFSEGIVFSVRPPKKSWKHIANLSGGEKTLSSLALVFALHHYKPTPLYVMDEIDAALDFKNVSIVGHYIKERTRDAQFVIISLRNNMFELADRLVGIYKTDNATKTVTINPGEFVVGGAGDDERREADQGAARDGARPIPMRA
ncbi:structural maintenance protein of chromosomes [Raphidocelis subcapitata]|uniref:Structural maintenance of chromosomes protein n=1 Tax=Raphidocelis subcapitata TaxID=307507 RepID=A0A2V0NVM9_9CHLO|nr:structural maintenance protein of chromosomes [Raphidocelis subcapitata]|eukprot:GBF90732.1 structural maintenance protein of chromosomes [Raphidocelis subcapitata]